MIPTDCPSSRDSERTPAAGRAVFRHLALPGLLVFALTAILGACALPQPSPAPPGTSAAGEKEQPRSEEPFLGIAHRIIPLPGGKPREKAYQVLQTVPGSAAARAGLRPGDLLLSYDGRRPRNSQDLRQYLLLQKQVGEPLQLKWRRTETRYRGRSNRRLLEPTSPASVEQLLREQETGETMHIRAERRPRILRATLILGRRGNIADIPDNADIFPAYEQQQDDAARLLQELFARPKLKERYRQWREKQEEDEKWDDGRRLPLVRYLRRDPVKLSAVLGVLSDELQRAGGETSPSSLLQQMAKIRESTPNIPAPSTGTGMARVINVLNNAALARAQGLANLNAEEEERLRQEFPPLLTRFVHSRYLDDRDSTAAAAENQELLQLAAKVNLNAMTEALLHLAALTEQDLLQDAVRELREREPLAAPPKGVSGQVLYAVETPAGRVVVGGPGPNRYRGIFALILDTGGDDIYLGDTGAGKQGIAVILDLSGDDEYSATDSFSQGSAFLGASLLADFGGDDSYRAVSLAQGAALLGSALLLDTAGNDSYAGQQYVQGFACFGIALLLDRGGNDRYEAGIFAQGVGGPDATGLLMDRAGSDLYRVGGRYPSTYGTEGIFQGAGQGLGIGFRFHASGGAGLLLEGGGADRMEAGNFAQGTGYFYALGLLRHFGPEEDIYTASRYGQGSAAHSALGAMLEDGGNDRYLSSFGGVVQGAAWDLSAALFLDKAGDDAYGRQDLHFSQGAGAKKGFGLFLDAAGSDHYHFATRGASNNRNPPEDFDFSIFIDAGPGADHYAGKPTQTKIQLRQADGGQVQLEAAIPLAELPARLQAERENEP